MYGNQYISYVHSKRVQAVKRCTFEPLGVVYIYVKEMPTSVVRSFPTQKFISERI